MLTPDSQLPSFSCFRDGAGRISRPGSSSATCHDPGCQYISLAGLGITSVARETFQGMLRLHNVDLADNAIVDLDDGAFDGAPNLKRLNLKGHSLSVIREGTFGGTLYNLVLLDMSYGSRNAEYPGPMLRFEPRALYGLTGLEVLNLYGNGITDETLAPGIFQRCRRLSRIDLSYNKLTAITDKTFMGLGSSLWSLGLTRNNIRCVSKGAFAGFTRLLQLGLAHNKLTMLPRGLLSSVAVVNGSNYSHYHSYDASYVYWNTPPRSDYNQYVPSVSGEGIFDPNLSVVQRSYPYIYWQATEWNTYLHGTYWYFGLNRNSPLDSNSPVYRGGGSVGGIHPRSGHIPASDYNTYREAASWGILELSGNSMVCRLNLSTASDGQTDTSKYLGISQFAEGLDMDALPLCAEQPPASLCQPQHCSECQGEALPAWLQEQWRFTSPACRETRTWPDILADHRRGAAGGTFKSGGLGGLRIPGKIETWVCFHGHRCLAEIPGAASDDYMCYAYDQSLAKFHAWGLNSELRLCNQ
jgi:hypothetical protein